MHLFGSNFKVSSLIDRVSAQFLVPNNDVSSKKTVVNIARLQSQKGRVRDENYKK